MMKKYSKSIKDNDFIQYKDVLNTILKNLSIPIIFKYLKEACF